MLKRNVGTVDRVIRILLGVGLIGWGIYAQNWLGALGAIPLLTGIMGTCGLYSLIGVSTCSVKQAA